MSPQQAYRKVRTALKRKELKRPSSCSRCRVNPGVASDGRAKIHAHHRDYNKPLAVEWLCAKCHRKDTPLPVGERNGQAKLTKGIVRMIRASNKSARELARILGVHNVTVGRARRGIYWLAAAPKGKP